tara:strand:- start:179 stop:550 length:372 start_codon:yes stop_codon:yes gene_type:complete
MDIQQSIKTCFKKFATFDGRASRSEYWWFQFFYILVVIVAVILDGVLVGGNLETAGALEIVSQLVLLLPALAVTARRLHDVDRSGWWMLVGITIVGLIPLFIWWLAPGTNKKNKYGNPIKLKS